MLPVVLYYDCETEDTWREGEGEKKNPIFRAFTTIDVAGCTFWYVGYVL